MRRRIPITMMKGYRPFTDKNAGLYPYSSLQVNVPVLIAQQIIKWGNVEIPEKNIYAPPNDLTHGREKEIHVTVLYGIHAPNPNGLRSLIELQEPFEIKLGRVSIFATNDDFDVVKVEAYSPGLFHLNQLLKNNISHTSCYNTFKPHVTIAYVKKNSCDNLIGNNCFRNWRWIANTAIFSSTNGDKTAIRFNTSLPALCS